MPKTLDLTIIVAATPQMGIGRGGALPWPSLKGDMSYFARVTKRVPLPSSGRNAVIMGRKTWESIPPKFRPLKDRINVVLTRSTTSFGNSGPDVVTVSEFDGSGGALEKLRQMDVGRVFVIGGSSVYQAALELPHTNRILLTKIYKDFECDTHFPIDLSNDRTAEGSGWRRCNRKELEELVREDVGSGKKTEGDVEFEFYLYSRP